jgi:hypothetical protein
MGCSSSNQSRSVSAYLRGALFFLFLFSAVAAEPNVAKATSAADAADAAVTIFVESGKLVGLPIDKNSADFVKEIVICGVDGANIADCAKNAAIATALKNVNLGPGEAGQAMTEMVKCLTSGTAATTCAADKLADKLPPEIRSTVKELAGCVNTSNFMSCARDKISSTVGAQINQAQREALNKALETLDQLRPDAELTTSASREKYATLKNILNVAIGIKKGNWAMVAAAAGPELAIMACNYVMAMFLGPQLASLLSPAVAAAVHNEVAAFGTAMNQFLGDGDAVGAAETMFSWYYTQGINNACALLPNGSAKDAVCGGINEAVQFLAGTVGDAAKVFLGAGKAVLEFLGVWKPIDGAFSAVWGAVTGVAEDIGELFGIGGPDWEPPGKCVVKIFGQEFSDRVDPDLNPQKYFVNHYLACASKAADLTLSSFGGIDTSDLNRKCTENFNQCVDPQNRSRAGLDKMCASMGTTLQDMARKSAEAQRSAAQAYAARFDPNDLAERGYKEALKKEFFADVDDFCNASQWQTLESQAAGKCSLFVGKVFPPVKAGAGGASCPLTTVGSGAVVACREAFKARFASTASVVGPDSEYCKKQTEWIKAHPCEVNSKGTTWSQDGNYKWENITIDCNIRREPGPGNGGIVILPPQLDPPDGRRQTGNGPGVPSLPNLGGSSGFNLVKNPPDSAIPRQDPNAPVAVPVLRLKPADKVPGPRAVVGKPPSTGSSGSNNSRRATGSKGSHPAAANGIPAGSSGSNTARGSNSNSAMDRLGGLGGGNINSVSGNVASGAPGGGGRRAPAGSSAPSGGSGPSGGSSGSYTSRPSGGSSGSYTSRPAGN